MTNTNKDIEEAFCAAFQQLYEDPQQLQERARWVAQGFTHLHKMPSHMLHEWNAMIATKGELMLGYGKVREGVDEQLHAHVQSMALHGHCLRLLEVMTNVHRRNEDGR
ncbi:hypothetical protein N5D45_06955 [Stenotrophomonas sp. GD03819]|uniref:hypothetical protein n=1 Tax=Stenotrophomonas TaxID=40323 RepID=UPI0004495212|nr:MULTISPECIES: hypothetical protein [Stenotrophomonas]KDE91817.1 hypothetical protein DF40_009280 [Stenotrophomonas maltophilia M30]MBA0455206.1 hypothetical protein [Stenotrophomonas maltophilia]MDH1791559.1 hypothetical protein [Stenotrophomonas sp. GD03819]HEL4163184.1 hypothetical protein [Stenotrophomonas maltophilia]